MKISIIACNKLKDKNILSLVQEYEKRLPFKIILQEIELKNSELKPDAKTAENNKLREKIIAQKDSGAMIILLDEYGTLPNSKEFSDIIFCDNIHNHNSISFIIAGAQGFEDKTRSLADKTISLGRMTYPHMLARLLLVEQIYRAWTIKENKSYHK